MRTELLEHRLRSQELSAADDLYRQFFPVAFKVALRILHDRAMAEDVAQESIWRAWKEAVRFDTTRGTLHAWISAIAHNLAIDYVRSALTKTESPAQRGSAPVGLTPEEIASVVFAVNRLHPIEKYVLTLMFYEGLSHAEIARRLNRPLGTIKTWVRAALGHVREQFHPLSEKADKRHRAPGSERIGRANQKRSETLLQCALEQERRAIALSDGNGAFLLYNKAADRLLNIAAAEADLSRDCSQRYGLFRSDGRTPYQVRELPLWRALDGEHTFGRLVFVRNSASPNGLLVNAGARPRFDAAGLIVGAILTCTPVADTAR